MRPAEPSPGSRLSVGGDPRRWRDSDSHELYPWPAEPWLRAMYVMSLDGAVSGSTGRSREISSEVDRGLMAVLRAYADVVLIGAGTMRSEHYSAMTVDADLAVRRRSAGLADAPRLAIVSRSLDLPWELPTWRASATRPVVLTTAAAPGEAKAVAREHAEVVELPDADLAAHLTPALAALGLRRIVCEGGPRLLGSLIDADAVDEVDLTLSPNLLGGGSSGVGDGPGLPRRYELAHVASDDDFLFLRYLKRNP